MSFATPADLMLGVLYALCFGLFKPRYVLLVTLMQVPVNLFLNYAFMFGAYHFPCLGVAGIGVGVACTYWLMLVILAVFLACIMPFRQYLLGRGRYSKSVMLELLRIGGPAGMHWLLQMGFFAFVALMLGKVSIVALAAYQVVLQVYSVFFNVVYNFNQAVTIRVAEALGCHSPQGVKQNYLGAYVFVVMVVVVILLILLFVQEPLIHLFTVDNVVASPVFLSFCREFFWLMPVFAILDLLGYVHFEVLRAYRDTRFPMWVAFWVYWVLAAPALYLAVHFGYIVDPVDIWFLMIVASGFSLLAQGLRYRHCYLKFCKNCYN